MCYEEEFLTSPPLGSELLQHSTGDIIVLHTQQGDTEYKIIEVK